MSKRQPEETREGDRESSREPDVPSIASRRRRLAKLIGRLLARHWLREKRSAQGKTQVNNRPR